MVLCLLSQSVQQSLNLTGESTLQLCGEHNGSLKPAYFVKGWAKGCSIKAKKLLSLFSVIPRWQTAINWPVDPWGSEWEGARRWVRGISCMRCFLAADRKLSPTWQPATGCFTCWKHKRSYPSISSNSWAVQRKHSETERMTEYPGPNFDAINCRYIYKYNWRAWLIDEKNTYSCMCTHTDLH